MKVFVFGLLLLVAVIYGEALQGHNCVRAMPGSGDCVWTVETCPPELDACAKVTLPSPYGESQHHSVSMAYSHNHCHSALFI
uniref:Uncharacterized protein n=1 Tax=Salmo trutta TaxID=8032 RepID=A0A674EMQ5_SALTR